MVYLTHHIPDLIFQGGQSRGQHDRVQGFPQPVKSSITFIILSQISCSKVQPPPPPRLPPSTEDKTEKLSALGYIFQLVAVIRETAANPGETFTQIFAEKYEGVFALYRMNST